MNIQAAQAAALRQNQRSKVQNLPWSLGVGLFVLAIYLAPLPFVERTWRTTGDEPHYLLAAHSLVTDLDFDLGNNYDRLDYLNFYYSRDIIRQVRTTTAGQQVLSHHLGLPLLIAPAYALGGRLGVLLFQAGLGALLAALTFKLTVHICRDMAAALPATLFVSLTPPLLIYPYLVYPELIGALLTTLVIYYALATERPAWFTVLLVSLALFTLPWLNRRFIPLALGLALLLVWSWRRSGSIRKGWLNPGIGGLATTLLSILLVTWLNAQFEAPARADFTPPLEAGLIWLRLARGIGWLLDQQRGLFIYAPIYMAAGWGLPFLLHETFKQKRRHWFILLPFLLSLGLTAAAGGFWIAWEVGPRFLVVGLPALAPLLALAWQHYGRGLIGAGLILLLFGLSLVNGWVILQNPELPYKLSLPLYYGQRFNLPLTGWLPDLAGYTTLFAVQADPAQTVTEQGQTLWFKPRAGRGDLIAPTPLTELPFGHYRLSWPLRVEPRLPPETELLRLSAQFLGGGQLFNKVITAADLPDDGRFGQIDYTFLNTNVDRWRTPLVFHANSTGQSHIWAGDLRFTPDPFYAWLLPSAWLITLIAGAGLSWYIWGKTTMPAQPEAGMTWLRWPRWSAWGLLPLLPLLALGYGAYQINQTARTYEATTLSHFAGRAVADPAAKDGRAWLVDPQVDPPQKAISGPFDFYEAGVYRVTFRMKLPVVVETGQELARLQVNATANFEELLTQPLHPEHFARPNVYHDFVLTITNPRRQALSFDVYYTGLAVLVIDEVRIERVEE